MLKEFWPGLRDILNSEKGLGFIALAVLSTIMLYQGHITTDQWMIAVPGGYGVYATTKTVASAMAAKSAPVAIEVPSDAKLPPATPATAPATPPADKS